MAQRNADIVIFGAGIAGLWTLNHLKRLGYDTLLLESQSVGGGQSIASQGIIHSGLKYTLAGKVNKLAQSISAMPDVWRSALKGEGSVDLSAARVSAQSQLLLIPQGIMGGFINIFTKTILGENVGELPPERWSETLKDSGFKGRVIYMNELVLDIPSVIQSLYKPYQESIKHIDTPEEPLEFLEHHYIKARKIIFTAAQSNQIIAQKYQHDHELQTQLRPLIMGFLKPAPFELYAHLVGASEKPIATITTHKALDGTLIWYLGGQVAEKEIGADIETVREDMRKALKQYFPALSLNGLKWSTLSINRAEGKSLTEGWMPDTPTVHAQGNIIYCWPTKLSFAPLLTKLILQKIDFAPSHTNIDWSFLPKAPLSQTPWDTAQWKKEF